MNAPLWILLSVMVFAGTHLVMGLPPLRESLVQRLGESRHVAVFSAVAGLQLGVVATLLGLLGDREAMPLLPDLLRVPLLALGAFGAWLAIAGLLDYRRSPMALFRTEIRAPTPVQSISRHPFFVGFGVFAFAHAGLAQSTAQSSFFLSIAVFAMLGALIQDRKLRRKWGSPFDDYCRVTSVVPFAATLGARSTSLGWHRDFALAGLLLALALVAHPLLSAANGAFLVAGFALGGLLLSWRRWHMGRRS